MWLCGCKDKMALFCFPCMLFGGEKRWTIEGYTNLKKLSENVIKHENSEKHNDNCMSMCQMGN